MPPKLKEYEIWSEGYACTGESAGAHFHGKAMGKNAKDSRDNFAKDNPEFAKYYDKWEQTYWGCSLYTTEKKARKHFG